MKGTLQLTPDETTWLAEYRQVLGERHPGAVVAHARIRLKGPRRIASRQ